MRGLVCRLLLLLVFAHYQSSYGKKVDDYIANLGNGFFKDGSILKDVRHVYELFLRDVLKETPEERLKAAITINCAMHAFNTYFNKTVGEGLFKESMAWDQACYSFYLNNCKEIVCDVFFNGPPRPDTSDFNGFVIIKYEDLKTPSSKLDYELLHKVKSDFEGANIDAFWKARHHLYIRVIGRWLARDVDFMKDAEARLEWKKFCELFDHGSDLKDFGSCSWLSEEGKLRSGPNWWWVVVVAVVGGMCVIKHIVDRHVHGHLPRQSAPGQQKKQHQ